MKDIYQIFDENLEMLARFVGKTDFKNCFNIVADLNRISTFSDFRGGVLIAEILEGIFSQVGSLLKQYDIPDTDRKQMEDKIGQNIILLSSTYKNDDKEKLYDILEDLRFTVTAFQFKCWNNWKRKEDDLVNSRLVREDWFLVTIIHEKWQEDYVLKRQDQLQTKSQKYEHALDRLRVSKRYMETIYLGTDVFDTIDYLLKKIADLEASVLILHEEHKQTKLDNLLAQNEASRKELESIFDIKPNEYVDTTSLDGLLKDYVNPKQNSQELIRSIRDDYC